MSQQELLKVVVQFLDNAGIEYMATGSIVSSMQGEPRSTHDVDLVVALKPEAATKIAKNFPPPDYYLSEQSIVDAIHAGTVFNLISLTEGSKVDFWILTDEPLQMHCEYLSFNGTNWTWIISSDG